MTSQNAVLPISSGAAVTELSGVAVGTDTVPAGCIIVARNTGAGTHNLVIGVNATVDGMQAGSSSLGSRQVAITAGQIMTLKVPSIYGDANGRCGFGVLEGTFAEIKYYVVAPA